MTSKKTARGWVGVVAILLLATWLGARHLNSDGIWFDEWWSVYTAGSDVYGGPLSPTQIWTRVMNDDPWHPPAYALLLAAWSNTTGWTVYSSRLLSLLLGLLSIALVYRLGRDLTGLAGVGLGGALIFGGSAWTIYYLHEMRDYTLYILLALTLLWSYRRLMRRSGWLWIIVFTLSALLLLYTHYFAATALALVSLWHLTRLRRRWPDRRWWVVVIGLGLASLLFLPWLQSALHVVGMAQNEQRLPLGWGVVERLGRDLVFGLSGGTAAIAGLLAIFSLMNRRSWRLWLLVGVYFVLHTLVLGILSLYELRYAAALMPLLALALGFGVYELAQRRVHPLILGALWFGIAWGADDSFAYQAGIQRHNPRDTRAIVDLIRPRLNPGDVVLDAEAQTLPAVLQHNPLMHYLGYDGTRLEIVEAFSLRGDVPAYARRVQQAVEGADRFWVIYSPKWISTEWSLFRYLMNQQGIYECATIAKDPTLELYAYGRIDPAQASLRLGDQIDLGLMSPPTRHADRLQTWVAIQRPGDFPAAAYSLGLHLLNAKGELVAQADVGLPSHLLGCHMAELSIAGLPAGEYQLHAVIYNWQSGERLKVNGVDGVTGDYPRLESILLEG